MLEGELAVARAHEKFDPEGTLVDAGVRERLAALLRDLVDSASPVGVAA